MKHLRKLNEWYASDPIYAAEAKEMLIRIDDKGYNQESVDGIQKIIDDLEI